MTYNRMQLKKDNYDNRDLKIKAFQQFLPTTNVKRSRDKCFADRFADWGSRLFSNTTL